MRCLDSTFLIDLLHENRDAVRKAEELRASGERLNVPAPVLAAAKLHQHILVTRDAAFSRIPGLAGEAY